MKWFLAIFMALSLLLEGVALSLTPCEMQKESCCCCEGARSCAPVAPCSSTSIIPAVAQVKDVSRVAVRSDLRAASIPQSRFPVFNLNPLTSFLPKGALVWSGSFSDKVSWHDYLRIWMT